jgi:hypothetical protein
MVELKLAARGCAIGDWNGDWDRLCNWRIGKRRCKGRRARWSIGADSRGNVLGPRLCAARRCYGCPRDGNRSRRRGPGVTRAGSLVGGLSAEIKNETAARTGQARRPFDRERKRQVCSSPRLDCFLPRGGAQEILKLVVDGNASTHSHAWRGERRSEGQFTQPLPFYAIAEELPDGRQRFLERREVREVRREVRDSSHNILHFM